MKFFLIFGPPAVGKMTVGKVLSKQTGLKLLHNHHSIEFVLQFFYYGSPGFRRLNKLIRKTIIEEIAVSELPGMIFTLVWDLNDPEDAAYVEELITPFKAVGATIYYVELEAALEERIKRNKLPDRIAEKPSKSNIKESEKSMLKLEELHRMNSFSNELDFKHYIRIDNSNKTPEEAVEMIRNAFQL